MSAVALRIKVRRRLTLLRDGETISRLERARDAKSEGAQINVRRAHEAAMAELEESLRERRGSIGPTPETASRLRPDIVVRLYKQGKLVAPEFFAASDIRDARAALAKILFPTRSMEASSGKTRGSFSGAVGLERLSPDEATLWNRYVWWSRRYQDRPFDGQSITRLQVILSVVEENIGLSQLERSLGIRRRHDKGAVVMPILQAALWDYAEVSDHTHGKSRRYWE